MQVDRYRAPTQSSHAAETEAGTKNGFVLAAYKNILFFVLCLGGLVFFLWEISTLHFKIRPFCNLLSHKKHEVMSMRRKRVLIYDFPLIHFIK